MIMSVAREDSETFRATKDRVFASIRMALQNGQNGYRYVETTINEVTGEIHTRIKPTLWPLLLSTKLVIQVQDSGTDSRVTVKTCSQGFIFGDVFDCYNGYIRDLMTTLKAQL